MVVTCDHCGARYRLAEERISGSGARITCPKCRHVFVVHNDEPAPPALDVHKLDYRSVGIQSWKVKVAIGLVYDFSDYRTLQKYIKEGRVTTTDNLSHDGTNWTEISTIPNLEQHFIDVYRTAEAAAARSVEESVVEDEEGIDEGTEEGTEEGNEEEIGEEIDDVDALAEALSEADDDGPELEIEVDAGTDEALEDEDVNVDQIADDLLAAVEAASRAEDEAIDLDMDALLEGAASAKRPAAVRRKSEQKAISSVPSTGNRQAVDHQFVDPFEAMKQQRSVRNRSSAGASPKKSKKKKAKELAAAKQQKTRRIVIFCVLAVALAAVVVQQLPSTDDRDAAVEEATQRAADAAAAKAKQRAESVRKQMQEDLKAELQTVNDNDVEAFRVEEDQLIARVPDHVRPGGDSKFPTKAKFRQGGGIPDGMDGVDQRSTSPSDLIALGDSAARGGRWADAASAYRRALEMEPGNASARALHGRALYKQGDVGGAEGELRQAAGAGSPLAHKFLGHIAREQGDDSGAVTHYQTYLRSSPADSASIEALIRSITN